MPEYNQQVDQASIIRDLSRRLYKLETSARVGINGIRTAIAAAAAPAVNALNTLHPLEAGDPGESLDVTVTGSKFLVIAMTSPNAIGPSGGGNFQAQHAAIYAMVDGAAIATGARSLASYYSGGGTYADYGPLITVATATFETSSEHLFQIGAVYYQDAAGGTTWPSWEDTALIVMPISA